MRGCRRRDELWAPQSNNVEKEELQSLFLCFIFSNYFYTTGKIVFSDSLPHRSKNERVYVTIYGVCACIFIQHLEWYTLLPEGGSKGAEKLSLQFLTS